MNKVFLQLGRWVFAVISLAMGLDIAFSAAQSISRDRNWMSHVSVIAMAVCCLVAAVGLFIWKRWSYLPSIIVSANAILGGLMGTFFGFHSLTLAICTTLAGILFMVWLLSPSVRNWRNAERS